MTKKDFNQFWKENYPDAKPIPYEFKREMAHRWFRIHSLPLSKRYAETPDEYAIILARQNELITDFFGENQPFLLVKVTWNKEKVVNTPSEKVWKSQDFDAILKQIADDEARYFFVGQIQNCLIAPYDGGVDIILKDSETRDFYKEKYKDWLSGTENGL